jgi:hypothetical protein
MPTKAVLLVLTLLFSAILDPGFQVLSVGSSYDVDLNSQELEVAALVNGTNAYSYDIELERIALNRDVSNYAFRSGGSAGATATAMWLQDQFESFGLETYLESFEFTSWDLPIQPELVVDDDGLIGTTDDQTIISSFQSEHFSWPTPETGVFGDLVVLPLPNAANSGELGIKPINSTLWDSINTHGKIVLIGREVRWASSWEQIYHDKLSLQPPAAVIYTWWYSWMSFTPPFFSSMGGRPTSSLGTYYWNLKIPTGWITYDEGLLVRNRANSMNLSAKITIPSVIGSGLHYNVVARLPGNADPEKLVVISGHYDTVMDAGFVDNGAGTAGVLELARVFTYAAREDLYHSNYTVVFVTFGDEELGLVGSINFVKQHRAEMKDIVAVINLDCIGSDRLRVAQTDLDGDFDLDELILGAASDLNVEATTTEPGGSDHEIFRDPRNGENIYSHWWPELTAGISDATPVKSSTMLISYPLFYSDNWNLGDPGWIHTSYDNSTSTQTLNWLEPDKLEDHIKVAALSVMRISPSSIAAFEPFSSYWWILAVLLTVIVVAVTVVYFARKRRLRESPSRSLTIYQRESHGNLT